MDFQPIFNWLIGLAPWVSYVFIALGTLVVLGIGIDKMIPDEKDKGFMKYVLKIPVLGKLLEAIAKFSPFNVRE